MECRSGSGPVSIRLTGGGYDQYYTAYTGEHVTPTDVISAEVELRSDDGEGHFPDGPTWSFLVLLLILEAIVLGTLFLLVPRATRRRRPFGD